MTKVVQLHRMNASQASVYTGPIGEAIVDTSAFTLRIQDGATPGGYRLMSASLNLNDVADKAAARNNLGAAPIDSPNFTTTASVDGDDIVTKNAVQSLANKSLVAPVLGIPASGNLSNCTNYDAVDLAGLATGMGGVLTSGVLATVTGVSPPATGIGALASLVNLPTLQAAYLLSVNIGAGDAAYSATAMIWTDGVSVNLAQLTGSIHTTISNAGQNIRASQNASVGTVNFAWALTRIQ